MPLIAAHGHPGRLPRRDPMRVAKDVGVTQLNGHPGRRVAAGSCKSRSVKDDELILIGAQHV
jgi:hypothetical protein